MMGGEIKRIKNHDLKTSINYSSGYFTGDLH
jgi:hypothetical protein